MGFGKSQEKLGQGKLGVGQTWIKLTACAGPMCKGIIPAKVVLIERKRNMPQQRLPLVSTLTKVFVHSIRHMRLKVYFINMCVLHVGPQMASHTPTHRLSVERVQKTNKPGHDFGFESCPQG